MEVIVAGRFQAGESRGIVDHFIGKQNLLPSTRLEIAGRRIVKASRHGDSRE